MSLEGSLETVALPEVLQLLSDTSKSGELLVRGDRGEGRLWFGQGRLTGFSVGRADQAADALFDMLRTGEGRFAFEADAPRPEGAHEVGEDTGLEVAPVLEVAQARLAEWTDIVSVVPSLDHQVRLAESVPEGGVTLQTGQWGLVVAIGEGRSVQDVLDRASLPEFDGCRSIKGLVDSGLATVSQPARKPRTRKSSSASKEVVAQVEDITAPEDLQVNESDLEAHDAATEVADFHHVADFDHVGASDQSVPSEEESGDEHPAEAPLDPGEFVFSAPASEDTSDADPESQAAESAEELAPWSVQLTETGDDSHEDDYVPQPVPLPEPHAEQYGDENGSVDHRAALAALLAEIPDEDDREPAHADTPDGLADRGPWTSHELDEMSGWGHEDQHHTEQQHVEETAAASFYDEESATPVAPTRFHSYRDPSTAPEDAVDAWGHESESPTEGTDEEDDDGEPKPEPVNRGLLLKFLSSVRS